MQNTKGCPRCGHDGTVPESWNAGSWRVCIKCGLSQKDWPTFGIEARVQWVEYVEPGNPVDELWGDAITIYIGIPQAIQLAKIVAETHNYTYKNDNDALQDFLAVHWAWIKQEEL